MNVRRTTGSGILVAMLAALAPAVSGAGGATASPAEEPLLTPAATPTDDLTATPPAAERSRLVALDADQLERRRAGDRIELDLFEDTTVTAVIDRRTDEPTELGGTTTWTGHVAGSRHPFTAVEVDGTHHLHLATAEAVYEVTLAGGETYRVVETATAQRGRDVHVPEVPEHSDGHTEGHTEGRQGGDRGVTAAGTGQDPVDQIDVAVVYPPSAPARIGADALQAQIALAISQTNQAFANSGIAARVRLAGTAVTATETGTDLFTMYDQLADPADGLFDDAHVVREQTHADLVSLWVSAPSPQYESCALGGLGGIVPNDSELTPFTVLHADCTTRTYTFAHEVGHNLSAQHDVAAANPPNPRGKAYARAYVDVPAATMTVMAYYEQCIAARINCTVIPYFSNPAVNTPAGRITGTAAADNARAINEQAPLVANYRQSQIYPGTVAITGSVRAGSLLRASAAGWAPANVTFTHQWLVDGVPVPGETGPTFRPSTDLIGRTVSLQLTASAPYYPSVGAASAPAVVAEGVFDRSRPRIKGKARPGSTLKVRLKGWNPKPSKARYQWFRNGKAIKKARKKTYRVTGRDRGKKLHVVVRAKRSGYESTRAKSKKVKVRR
ncbi:M12 family metallo-peptidase [Nocardioides solisilvae]|uniref:M12 family metallo-peptidase n=1 Tax=Nocardioides solisilvae TaxID=1542435 RepID=UPI0013A59AC0|nr:M12 family metallo-peptidase [Nocardioides solisilvae]